MGHATGTAPEARLLKIGYKTVIMDLTWADAEERAKGIEPS